jgi:hypothetical protein
MNSISTFDINKEPLLDLLRDIKQGKIQLVDFQRSWCWDEERIERVIASVSLGFPVGAVMLLQQGNPDVKFKPRPVEGTTLNHPPTPAALILDGQQRLTSLFMSLLSDEPVWIDRGKRYSPVQRWYYIDIDKALNYPYTDRRDAIFGLTVDRKLYRPGEAAIDCSTPEKEFESGLFPVSQVFNFAQWRTQYCEYWDYDRQKLALIEQFAATVIKKFEHYQMGLFVLKAELPKEAVCYIFEENNKRQCELTHFDLLTSAFAATEFDLRQDWTQREQRLAAHRALRLLKPTDFLQAIALMVNYQRRTEALNQGGEADRLPAVVCNRQDVLRLDLSGYLRWVEPISQGFEAVARFLHTQAMFDADDVPYPMQLVVMVPLFVILGETLKLDWARQRIEQWFYCGAASGIYSRSRESTAAKDLIEIPQWLNGGEIPATIKEAHLPAERLESLVNSGGATYRAITALLRRDGALDFSSGESITAVRYFQERIENHHIFSQQWCKRQGISRSRYNSIVNKTPLTAKTNNLLGGKAPSAYLAHLEAQGMSRQRIDQILRSHLIEPETLRNDDFEAFFERRTAALLAMIGKAMGKSSTVEAYEGQANGKA